MADKMTITSLKDGTLKVETDKISAPKLHGGREDVIGDGQDGRGKTKRVARTGHAHTHTHESITHSH